MKVKPDSRSAGTISGAFRSGRADRFDIPRRQHRQHALIEAQVADGMADLPLLDPPHAVARQPGQHDRSSVDQPHIPEARDQQAALHALDHVVHRRRRLRAFEDVVHRAGSRVLLLLLRPEPGVGEVLEDAVLDEREARRRNAFIGAWRGRQVRVHRIAVEVQLFVEHLLADAALAILAGERAAAFIGRARVEAVGQEADEIGNRLRFEDDRVDAGLDRLRLARPDRLVDGLVDDMLRVQPRKVEMVR